MWTRALAVAGDMDAQLLAHEVRVVHHPEHCDLLYSRTVQEVREERKGRGPVRQKPCQLSRRRPQISTDVDTAGVYKKKQKKTHEPNTTGRRSGQMGSSTGHWLVHSAGRTALGMLMLATPGGSGSRCMGLAPPTRPKVSASWVRRLGAKESRTPLLSWLALLKELSRS